MTYKCSKCMVEKPLSEFHTQKDKASGHRSHCKKCCNSDNRNRAAKNKVQYRLMHQKYYHATKPKWQAYQKEYGVKWRKDNFERRKASHKKWLEKHPNWRSEYERKLRKEDPQFKLTQNLRRRVRSTIAKGFKSASTFTLLGCTIDEFKLHIESQWTEGMSWDNYGLHGWHIDHIKPCYAFDLTKPEEQRACFHFSNQRPLWQKDNDSRKRPGWHEIWKNRKPPKA